MRCCSNFFYYAQNINTVFTITILVIPGMVYPKFTAGNIRLAQRPDRIDSGVSTVTWMFAWSPIFLFLALKHNGTTIMLPGPATKLVKWLSTQSPPVAGSCAYRVYSPLPCCPKTIVVHNSFPGLTEKYVAPSAAGESDMKNIAITNTESQASRLGFLFDFMFYLSLSHL